MKAVRILFILICSAIFLSNGVFRLWDTFCDEAAIPKRSSLEARTYQDLPEISLAQLTAGEFQAQFEQFIADSTPPNRDDILLFNALWQRMTTAFAATTIGYDVYPTFYGSTRYLDTAHQAIFQAPATTEKYPEETLAEVTALLESFMDANDSITWVYYLPESSDLANVSPVRNLWGSKEIDYNWAISYLDAAFGDKCRIVSSSYDNVEEYTAHVFRSDHHFNMQGAVDCYKAVIRSFGKSPIELGPFYKPISTGYIGSNARTGLIDSIADDFYDVVYSPSTILVDGSQVGQGGLELVDKQFCDSVEWSKMAKYGLYGRWFHDYNEILHYENVDMPENVGSLLVISDSFDDSCDHLFAEHYRHVYLIDPRSYKQSISSFIEQHPDITDAAITLSFYSYKAVNKRMDTIR